MRTITIGRYTLDGSEPRTFTGYVEGLSNSGQSWIVYLDDDGLPALYWPRREESGAVIGQPIDLQSA